MQTSVQNMASESALSQVWGRINPTPIVRGEGTYVFDADGNRFIDFTSGIAVTATGHCHPKIVSAVQTQASQLIFGQMNCMLPQATQDYANSLRQVTPEFMDTFFFSNSGAEAVEGAVKLARASTKRPNVIAFDGGFHGRTTLAMALTSSKAVYRAGYQPLPAGVFVAPFPAVFRLGWDLEVAVDFCVTQLERILQTQSTPQETAAMIVEPVLGEGGFIPAPPSFLQELRRICDHHGILLIVDEIQSGFGRTGQMWAHEESGILPDIMTMAKGIASGLPMSAIGASGELMQHWLPGSHGGTYGGGSAPAMAAAQATLEVIEEEKLIENARRLGQYLTKQLETLISGLNYECDVRGPGLMVGIEFVRDNKPAKEFVAHVQQECFRQRLMLLTCGTDGNVIRWLPPLNVTQQQIDDALAIFERSIQSNT